MNFKCIIDRIETCFYDIKYGIENLINWFPVIWKDRNWDHCYIYTVLRHKLHLTEQQIREHGHHVDNERDADNIKVCVNLLDRLIKDEYHDSAFKRHEEKWGEPELSFKDLEDKPDLQGVYINYPNVKTEKDKEQERKEFQLATVRETELREQDLDMLFKNMRKYIQTWWD